MTRSRLLTGLCWLMGIADIAIGAGHIVFGMDTVPDTGSANATMDSMTRFFAAVFLGYGAAWIIVARRSPIPAKAVRLLAGIFLLGGLSRLVSWADAGRPDGFQIFLMTLELCLPPLYFWLATASEKETAG